MRIQSVACSFWILTCANFNLRNLGSVRPAQFSLKKENSNSQRAFALRIDSRKSYEVA
jgi:hypothetical protein